MTDHKTYRDVIKEALDAFNVDDFITPGFNDAATDKIISELEWRNFKIVELTRAPLPNEGVRVREVSGGTNG